MYDVTVDSSDSSERDVEDSFEGPSSTELPIILTPGVCWREVPLRLAHLALSLTDFARFRAASFFFSMSVRWFQPLSDSRAS